MTAHTPLILGIGGTTRRGSTSEIALRFALERAESFGCRTALVAGPDLPGETYDPARPERSPAASHLVAMMRQADGIIVGSPSYHGSLSGLIKNALDFSEDLRTDARVYFDHIAFGCIVTADGAQALGSTVAALRSIAHALRAWPTPYAALINVTQRPFDTDGQPNEPATGQALALVAEQVSTFAQMKRAHAAHTAS